MSSIAQQLRSNVIKQFSELEQEYNCVLWVRNDDYSQQLFVGPNYEKFWGRSCLSLYEDPDLWQTYLVTEEGSANIEQLKQRNTPINPKHTEFYCFKDADGQEHWMQDRSFRITDHNGKCMVIAGVAYPIIIEDMTGDAQAKVSDIIDQIVIKFSTILASEYDASGQQEKTSAVQTGAQELLDQLSKREIEVLYYLLHGKSMHAIAETLDLSPRTVESYINNLKNKLQCDSKSEIIIIAIENNLLTINISL